MIRFRPAADGDTEAWLTLLAGQPSGDFLHDPAWAPVTAHDGQPQRRYVLDDDDGVVAIVAVQERALPAGRRFWYVPHGPVLDWTDPRAAERVGVLLAGLRDAASDRRVVAVKLEPRLERGAAELSVLRRRGLRPLDEVLQVGQTRLVELADDETLLAGFDKDTRYGVRRAEREGVTVEGVVDADDTTAVDALHELVRETQARAGFALPSRDRYRVAWQSLAAAGRAAILEARRQGELLASGMVVLEGDRSFYLFSGSRRERRGEPKRYASYALQWHMMRLARSRGARTHDLWGVAPAGAGPDHRWHGVGLFKKGFGGREVAWAGSWDLVVDPTLYRLRTATGMLRGWIGRLRR